ncbi:MAG: methyltransferase [Candidatus Eisenbacteria bacterium]
MRLSRAHPRAAARFARRRALAYPARLMSLHAATPFTRWFDALEARHLATLTFPEVRRALEALSAVYVQRRDRLHAGADLETAGKRAAFALFYGPLHFLVAEHVARELALADAGVSRVLDLGCGTGVVGIAAALACGGVAFEGVDRNRWAVAEARWNAEQFALAAQARPGDLLRARPAAAGTLVTLGWAVNELEDDARDVLAGRVAEWRRAGSGTLVIEPIARRMSPWWDDWAALFRAHGGRADEWAFAPRFPERLALMDKAAGLDHREMKARTLYLPPR